jgi:hypothetical protein
MANPELCLEQKYLLQILISGLVVLIEICRPVAPAAEVQKPLFYLKMPQRLHELPLHHSVRSETDDSCRALDAPPPSTRGAAHGG